MGEKGIDYIERDNIGIIKLNRPNVLNAVDLKTAQHLREAVIAAERDSAVRCVLLMGAGKHFSAGGDVRFFHGTLDLPLEQRQCRLVVRVVAAGRQQQGQVPPAAGKVVRRGLGGRIE